MNNQDLFDKALAAGVEFPYLERYQYDDWYTTTGKPTNFYPFNVCIKSIRAKSRRYCEITVKYVLCGRIRDNCNMRTYLELARTSLLDPTMSLHRNGGMRERR